MAPLVRMNANNWKQRLNGGLFLSIVFYPDDDHHDHHDHYDMATGKSQDDS